MDWARILAFVTGMVDRKLLARNEDLVAENRILKAQLKGRLKLSDAERATLAAIGHRLSRGFSARWLPFDCEIEEVHWIRIVDILKADAKWTQSGRLRIRAGDQRDGSEYERAVFREVAAHGLAA
jgi:hypothetical protein